MATAWGQLGNWQLSSIDSPESNSSSSDWSFFLQIVQAWKTQVHQFHQAICGLNVSYRSTFIDFYGQTNTLPHVDHILDKTVHHFDCVVWRRGNSQLLLATWNSRIIDGLCYIEIILGSVRLRKFLDSLPERSGHENEAVHPTVVQNVLDHRPTRRYIIFPMKNRRNNKNLQRRE